MKTLIHDKAETREMDLDDDEIAKDMPSNWWLNGTSRVVKNKKNHIRLLFVLQVHRQDKEVCSDCTAQPSGLTRLEQRAAAARDTAAVRAEARAADRAAERATDPYYHEEKKARLTYLNLSLVEKQSESVSKNLAMFERFKESFIRLNGEEAYDEKVNELLSQLPSTVPAMPSAIGNSNTTIESADGSEI